ncbi:hypothetical protein CEUSTIGMA_g11146.t1 [Chlamydomonas eustigma]|uniref:Autophagy-related protein 9 n=1 Tax=Chlamydomonas eustigma TaxID=1157962 RepID=A0A250XKU6_9CHLO|nr:hypothetical protein CEUSTIGMA_g11146.t1 [Chlamydomonas eustigma]|eukprot:GAX83721.1 hypothetical protein CEUSTIGMA_g11146.t1 [Chlamydomonas eustigma]
MKVWGSFKDQELVRSRSLEGKTYDQLPRAEEPDLETPILAGESYEWAAIQNLDAFFSRSYRYWHGRGLTAIIISGLLNVLALAFTIAFSTLLLLFVNWSALHSECIVNDTCDISEAVLYSQPLRDRGILLDLLILTYLGIFSLYWLWTLIHFLSELKEMRETRHFYNTTLGLSDRQVSTMTWAEVVNRLVLVQRTRRLCVVRDLNELDIVGRIMRKDNFLIAMINMGIVTPTLPLPRWLGMGPGRSMLTKTLEWNLRWCILDHMFDEHSFRVRKDFLTDPAKLQKNLTDPAKLQKRFKLAAIMNLVLCPFLLVFLVIYFFMHNAEKFYSHPGALGSRRWSALAKWQLRELNELPHYLSHRLAASHTSTTKYLAQFPSQTLAAVARFVAFVTGSIAALLLLVTMMDDGLLERPLLGRHIVWWLAALGVVLTASRTLVSEDPVAYDPEKVLAEVAAITHHMPRHWRGRAHTPEVQGELSSMFPLKVQQFLEEMASVFMTPFLLYFVLPISAASIVTFVSECSVEVPGVGHVCSLAAFDLAKHGNMKYGAPMHGCKGARSRQGKMEKSLLTFIATYPTWEPPGSCQALLTALDRHLCSNGANAMGHMERRPWLHMSHAMQSHVSIMGSPIKSSMQSHVSIMGSPIKSSMQVRDWTNLRRGDHIAHSHDLSSTQLHNTGSRHAGPTSPSWQQQHPAASSPHRARQQVSTSSADHSFVFGDFRNHTSQFTNAAKDHSSKISCSYVGASGKEVCRSGSGAGPSCSSQLSSGLWDPSEGACAGSGAGNLTSTSSSSITAAVEHGAGASSGGDPHVGGRNSCISSGSSSSRLRWATSSASMLVRGGHYVPLSSSQGGRSQADWGSQAPVEEAGTSSILMHMACSAGIDSSQSDAPCSVPCSVPAVHVVEDAGLALEPGDENDGPIGAEDQLSLIHPPGASASAEAWLLPATSFLPHTSASAIDRLGGADEIVALMGHSEQGMRGTTLYNQREFKQVEETIPLPGRPVREAARSKIESRSNWMPQNTQPAIPSETPCLASSIALNGGSRPAVGGGGNVGELPQQQQEGHPRSMFAEDGSSSSSILRCSVFGLLPFPYHPNWEAVDDSSHHTVVLADELPPNETLELSRRLSVGHCLLQSLYEASDTTVQHRHAQAEASRSMFHTRSSGAVSGFATRAT